MIRALAALALLFGCAAGARAQGTLPHFDEQAAHQLLRRQVAFGPRVPNTPGHRAQLAWMEDYLRARADTVIVQRFDYEAGTTTLQLANVFARFRPELSRRILLLAHWDTRPSADMDMDESRQEEPIDGANDGASGTAVLLHLADMLSRHQSPIGVDLLFTDAEDYPGHMYQGATYFAANLGGYRPMYGVLVDMVGDREPLFPVEGNSREYAPEIVDHVWNVAHRLGLAQYFPKTNGTTLSDDHVPLNNAGIKTINIIDFDYGPGNAYWHTHADRVENTSPLGLGVVGRVLVGLIF